MEMKLRTPCPPRNYQSVKLTLSILTLVGALALAGSVFAHNGSGHKDSVASGPEATPDSPPPHVFDEAEGGHSGGSGKTLGETVYKHMCGFCHGLDGNGGGKATDYLFPWARDFRKGVFKHRSTPSGSLPLDEDIARTISRGIPGTAMPAWGGALSEEETQAVVQYIKKFSKRFQEEKPRARIVVKSIPPTASEDIEKGEKLYQELRCARCHGSDLKGDGIMADQLYDIWDHRLFVYDLENPNTYKWGYEKKDIYMTLTAGVDGTPMKSFSHLKDEERWSLAAFLRSKVQTERHQKAEYEIDLHVKKISGKVEIDPDHEIWKDAPKNVVHMIQLNARRDPVNRIQVQSVVDGENLGIRVQWDDPTANRTSSRHQDFKDAVAVEFALGDVVLHKHGHNEPFFGMGNRGKVVNIWQWRADWQQEIETKKRLEYATEGMQDMDVMIFGGEVNPVESLNPFREAPVEELNAEGFGTLTPQPTTRQNVAGNGVWKDGKWTVVFSRPLKSLNKWDVKLIKKGVPILAAFAVWDGAHQDRNGRKVVSMWQRLHLP